MSSKTNAEDIPESPDKMGTNDTNLEKIDEDSEEILIHIVNQPDQRKHNDIAEEDVDGRRKPLSSLQKSSD